MKLFSRIIVGFVFWSIPCHSWADDPKKDIPNAVLELFEKQSNTILRTVHKTAKNAEDIAALTQNVKAFLETIQDLKRTQNIQQQQFEDLQRQFASLSQQARRLEAPAGSTRVDPIADLKQFISQLNGKVEAGLSNHLSNKNIKYTVGVFPFCSESGKVTAFNAESQKMLQGELITALTKSSVKDDWPGNVMCSISKACAQKLMARIWATSPSTTPIHPIQSI